MKNHLVRPQRSGHPLPREEHLAWKIAETAADDAQLDPDAAEMAALRIVDNWGIAIAALGRPSVASAFGAARAHSRQGGATLIGLGKDVRVDPFWAGYANATAIRELDFNDSFFAVDTSHPSDGIGPLVAVAQAKGLNGHALLKGIVTSYEVQVSLAKGVPLNRHKIDHVAHLGPAVAAGIGAALGLEREPLYHAISLAAHLSVTTRQTRKGQISSYKACAPGHVGQIAMLAVDRAMRGETSPAPVYEGEYGILSVLLDGPTCEYSVPLPEREEPKRAILETYPKAHAAAYHGQALIDLAFRMRAHIPDLGAVEDIKIVTKELTHVSMGSGSGDPEKWDPKASRETLDHSAPYLFAVALEDGNFHHVRSYTPERAARPETVILWQKIRTVDDPRWTTAYEDALPLDKAHGGQIVITMKDGSVISDEIINPDAHPRGARPFDRKGYHRKFEELTQATVAQSERNRFLEVADSLQWRRPLDTRDLYLEAAPDAVPPSSRGLFGGKPGSDDHAR
jgi:2-methylcitrate dehydratase